MYDVLAVSPSSLAARRDEWKKVLDAWYMAVDYLNDPDTRDDAISIMAARVGIEPAEYEAFIDGTKILTKQEAQAFMKKADGFGSLYGSTAIADQFNVDNKVYADKQPVDNYIDPSLLLDE
jgi:NitT/TauT family transport system substrate-binding protein